MRSQAVSASEHGMTMNGRAIGASGRAMRASARNTLPPWRERPGQAVASPPATAAARSPAIVAPRTCGLLRWPSLVARLGWPGLGIAALVMFSLLVQCSPAAQRLLEFNRLAIESGQWWRLLTGNLVHYDWLHFAANVGAFAALGWLAVIRRSRAVLVVLPAAIAVGLGVYLWADATVLYRGISGVDCALLAWLLATTAWQEPGWRALPWAGALLLMFAKSVYETATGTVLLPTSAPTGVEVVNITHVVGLAVGALAAAVAPPARPPVAPDQGNGVVSRFVHAA